MLTQGNKCDAWLCLSLWRQTAQHRSVKRTSRTKRGAKIFTFGWNGSGYTDSDADPAKWCWSDRIRIHNTDYANVELLRIPDQTLPRGWWRGRSWSARTAGLLATTCRETVQKTKTISQKYFNYTESGYRYLTKILNTKSKGYLLLDFIQHCFICRPSESVPLCRSILGLNPRLLRLWHWQSDARTTRLDFIHIHGYVRHKRKQILDFREKTYRTNARTRERSFLEKNQFYFNPTVRQMR